MSHLKTVCLFIIIIVFSKPYIYPRINFIEFYKPGVDTEILELNKYDIAVDVLVCSGSRKNIFELPAIFSCSIAKKLELGARFGVVSYGAESGISDIDLGVKYLLNPLPSIVGEFGLSLPTADYKKGLGPGNISFILNWLIKMKLAKINSHFNLGYRIFTENADREKAGNQLNYIVGVEYPLRKDIVLFGEIKGKIHAPRTKSGKTIEKTGYQEVYIGPGMKYIVDPTFDFYSSILFGSTDSSYDIIFFIGLLFKL